MIKGSRISLLLMMLMEKLMLNHQTVSSVSLLEESLIAATYNNNNNETKINIHIIINVIFLHVSQPVNNGFQYYPCVGLFRIPVSRIAVEIIINDTKRIV